MAATSTNKQPLLVDHILHNVVNLDTSAVQAIDIGGTNTATLVVDSTRADGCILEDVYLISRSTAPFTVNLYISTAADYLRPNEGVFIGQIQSATTKGAKTTLETMPKILAPMPHTPGSSTVTVVQSSDGGDPETVTTTTTTVTDNQFRALYIPKGKALWAGREDIAAVNDGPLLGVQGGWY